MSKILGIMLSIVMLSCQVSYSADDVTYSKTQGKNEENISKLFEKMHILENDANSLGFMLCGIDDNLQ